MELSELNKNDFIIHSVLYAIPVVYIENVITTRT